MHVTPISDFWKTGYVIVGDVHAARIANNPVYDNYFPVVAVPYVVYPWKSDGIEFDDFNTSFLNGLDVFFL